MMDGGLRIKKHERLMARSGSTAASGHVTDRFDSAMHPRGRGGGGGGGADNMGMSQAPDRAQMAYDYGYTGGSFHGSFQPNDLAAYGSDLTRTRAISSSSQEPLQRRWRALQEQQQQQRQRHRQQQEQQQHQHQHSHPQPSPVPYESILYGFSPQGPTQGGGGAGLEVVPPYSTRQSAAMEALSSQFAVPQYFNPEETATVSPYMNAHLSYTHSMPRPNSTTQPFPTTMADFTSIGTCSSGRLDAQINQPAEPQQQQQQQSEHDSSSFDEAYAQYQRALRITFDHTRDGRLLDASRSLVEISEWLVNNARDLGILRDDHLLYKDRLQLWNEFNLCWLAVCQKQKDMAQDLAATGHHLTQANLLSRDRMESMGKDLIQLCDQLEQYGLVDYQMGIWEEEILCVLGQCLDIMDSRPELLRVQAVPQPTTAAPRP